MVISKNNKPQGFIAIVSLLIITTISMIFAMSMLKDGVDNASLSLSSIFYENSRVNAVTCLEDVLYRIKGEQEFSTNLNYTITDEDSCATSIEWFTPEVVAPGITETLATLNVTGTSNTFNRNFRYQLNISRFDVNYSDGSQEYMNSIDILSVEELTS
ncbi:hypothetical protein KKA95_03765 [Patescibacteria group bacterium]|nr:hypothetical protein [Patescibacteria group bacterium]